VIKQVKIFPSALFVWSGDFARTAIPIPMDGGEFFGDGGGVAYRDGEGRTKYRGRSG
jgi:hypothetical protein